MKIFFVFLSLALISSLGFSDPTTPFQAIENQYLKSSMPVQFEAQYMWKQWGGYCSNADTPFTLEQSALAERDLGDDVLGTRAYLFPLFGRPYISKLNPRDIKMEVDRILLSETFSSEYFPSYALKSEQAIVMRQYPKPDSNHEKQLEPLYLYYFRQNLTESKKVYYLMKMVDYHTNEVVKLCYYNKDLSYGVPE